jgi:translation initiation factor IF-2
MLEPKKQEITLGRAEVKAVFNVPKVGPVAGCYVLEGKVLRSASARIWRGKDLLYEGKIASLKRFKEDVREVQQGYECGLSVEGFKDWKEGDIIEVYTFEEVPVG